MAVENLSGLVERVTYFTEETGYCVLKVSVAGRPDVITLTGKVPTVHPGEIIEASGEWVTIPNWGRQFRADSIRTKAPATLEGIEKYLASGLIEGIGPSYAKRIVAKFGHHVFDVIDRESKRLQEVEGIGEKRRKEIKESWETQKAVQEIMVFLHQNGISTAKAVKIYQTYGSTAVQLVKDNPYRLAEDIPGIGFRSADVIAQRVGLAVLAPRRLQAGLIYALTAAQDDGHAALPAADLEIRAAKLLDCTAADVRPHIQPMLEQHLLAADIPELIYHPSIMRAEKRIAEQLLGLLEEASAAPADDPPVQLPGHLAPEQQLAVTTALRAKVMILTGGPGVGKTTTLKTILQLQKQKGRRCVLAAPTGRASRRMSEATGMEARTIHRLLEFQPGKGFTRNRNRSLDGDYFVLDECSMIDTLLMAAFLSAIPQQAQLLFVGDADQLPSVGPGNVLRDMLTSEKIPTVRLTKVFRQAAASRIITAAHAINAGELPPLENPKDSDFFFVERPDADTAIRTMLSLIKDRIPAAFGLHPVKDVQVLTPMNKGSLGTANLNRVLQDALNPLFENTPEIERYGMKFRQGDKVIQIRNNYEKDAFNGDIGTITHIEDTPVSVDVLFEGNRKATYQTGDLDELRLAYAITIHKSQGSEFPAVVMPVTMQHYVMLQRNLIYTGVTRGKQRVILIGEKNALELAAKTTGSKERWSGLRQRLSGEVG